WSNIVTVMLLLLFNWVHKFDVFQNSTRVLGMNYSVAPAKYTNEELRDLGLNPQWRKEDSLNTIAILENWKAKNTTDPQQKPKLVILSCSGGGLRSTLWTFYTMQYLDSLTGGQMMKHMVLICGSSGGMVGAAYMRELCLREEEGEKINHLDPAYRENAGEDVLNPMAFSIAVNDWFLPLRHAEYDNMDYSRNRAWAFEEKMLSNTGNVLEKKLSDYTKPEREAKIPMMFFAPTIVNDGRKLIIASQGVSYLSQPAPPAGVSNQALPDGVEFSRFFSNQGAANARFMSVLRMNATFPYITPLTDLPSEPVIEVFDAGMRDNFGVDNLLRFLYTFRTWISENTSGVVLLQTRDKSKIRPVEETHSQTVMQALSRPMGSFYGNLFVVQDYNHDYAIDQAGHWLGAPIDVLDFELTNDEPDLISLSWHLTGHEKTRILSCMSAPGNQKAAARFRYLLTQ
ncbi:MAG TPA: patatin-like phospholipase family protein, partial [Bacteroidia bacterium]|nr:patatin-like phospholipase family protein [Bacteroidia bacterium]